MTSFAKSSGQHSALMEIRGEWSNALPLREIIAIYESGSALALDNLEFEFQLRESLDDTATALTMSTDNGSLDIVEVVNEDGDTIDALQFDDVSLTTLAGDYFADLIMKDASGDYTHLAHGVVTIRNDPGTPGI